jgi:hypothetical protein
LVIPLHGHIKKAATVSNCLIVKWAQLGTIQRPPDYESGALTS